MTAAAPKDFPPDLEHQPARRVVDLRFTVRELMIAVITVPLMIGLTAFVRYTKTGKAMRAVAQNPVAAQLMGVDINRVIGATFLIGGALGGAASVIYALYNNTIRFDLGYRAGMDAFTAAVLGGIGSPGACWGSAHRRHPLRATSTSRRAGPTPWSSPS